MPVSTYQQPTRVLLEVDDQGRVDLSGLAQHRRYLAHKEHDGTIILTPAAVLPQAELDRLLAAAHGDNMVEIEISQRTRAELERVAADDLGGVTLDEAVGILVREHQTR